MTTYKITANEDCHYCHGSGTVYDSVPYGSTTADMPSTCGCVEEQVPEEFNDFTDEIEVIPSRHFVSTGWAGGDGPEFEYDN